MKFIGNIALLASVASAASMRKYVAPLDVQIEQVGNSGVKASIKNSGSEDLKVLKTGSILDSAPIEKVRVSQGSKKVDFEGIRLRISTADFKEDAFQTIPAGQTVVVNFDAAELHDISASGEYDFVANGRLSYAAANSTKIAGSIPYTSNTLNAKVDGTEAAKVRAHFLNKRTVFSSDCSGTKGAITENAVSNCAILAEIAGEAALSNSASVAEYFMSTSAASTVAEVFSNVASECGGTGVSETYCTDVLGGCSSNVLAYTLPSESIIAYCDLFYDYLPEIPDTCHGQDMVTTVLHETTHLTSVAGTEDLGYGYDAATSLSSSEALNNADSYALFANAVYVGC
ncbi:neutral protease 2-like protein [Xylaria intraflava]|nr:neutral protease 2-like protein [Xylaria intraflava]